jgi:hypothetical protein
MRCASRQAPQPSEWWDSRFTANPETLQTVTLEARIGGRMHATHSDLGDHKCGVVAVCEPGHRLTHSFTLAQDSEHPTEVAVGSSPTQMKAPSSASRTAAGQTATPSTARSSRSGRRCSTGRGCSRPERERLRRSSRRRVEPRQANDARGHAGCRRDVHVDGPDPAGPASRISPELSGATALTRPKGLTLLPTMNLPTATRGTRGRGP